MGSKTIGSLLVRLGMDSKAADKSIKNFERSLVQAGKRMESVGRKMTMALTLPIVGFGVAAVKAASDAEETFSKFGVVFSKVSADADKAFKVLRNEYGLSSKASKQLLSDTGDLLTGFGFSQEAALEMSTEVNKLAVDLASFTNFSGGAEGASQALTKALLGERESVKALGIAILESDVKKQVAINKTKGLTFETERQAKAYATLELALGQSKNAIGDYARTSDSFANQFRLLKARTSDLAVEFGQLLLPIIKSLTTFVGGLVDKFIALDIENKKAIIGIAALVAGIGPLLYMIPQLVKGFQFLFSTTGLITASILALAAATLYVTENWQVFADSWKVVWWGIKSVAIDSVNSIIGAVNGLITAMNVVGRTSIGLVSPLAGPDASELEGNSQVNPFSKNDRRHSLWTRKEAQSPTEFIESIGTKIFNKFAGGFDVGKFGLSGGGTGYNMSGVGMPGEGGGGGGGGRIGMASPLSFIGGVGQNTNIGGFDRMAGADIAKIMPDYEGAFEEQTAALKAYEQTWQSLSNTVSGAIDAIGSAMINGEDAFKAFGKVILGLVAQMVKLLITALVTSAIMNILLPGSSAAVGGIGGLFKQGAKGLGIPGFADGALVYGPTMAMVGDNKNAKNDPEVISPLSKLKGMMGAGGGGEFHATVSAEGIELLMIKRSQNSARMGRPSIINF